MTLFPAVTAIQGGVLSLEAIAETLWLESVQLGEESTN
jgi:hypothetical protein